MNDSMGILVNGHTIRMERLLPGPIERVWQFCTDSDLLNEWLMPGSIDAKPGGLIEFVCPAVSEELVPGVKPHSDDVISRGLISECDPPRVLAFSWFESIYDTATEFRIELEERDDQVLLVLTHSHLDPEWMAVTATGWHVQMAVLLALLKGEEKPDIAPLFDQLLKEYRALFASAGVVVIALSASPAFASELSNEAYKQIQSQRHELLVNYDHIWKDAKNIDADIAVLEKSSVRNDKAIDALHRDLKDKKSELRRIELDVHDLDKVLQSS